MVVNEIKILIKIVSIMVAIGIYVGVWQWWFHCDSPKYRLLQNIWVFLHIVIVVGIVVWAWIS